MNHLAIILQFLVMKFTKKVSKFNKVVISGDGADEMFAGYKDSRLFYLKSYIPSFNFKI